MFQKATVESLKLSINILAKKVPLYMYKILCYCKIYRRNQSWEGVRITSPIFELTYALTQWVVYRQQCIKYSSIFLKFPTIRPIVVEGKIDSRAV